MFWIFSWVFVLVFLVWQPSNNEAPPSTVRFDKIDPGWTETDTCFGVNGMVKWECYHRRSGWNGPAEVTTASTAQNRDITRHHGSQSGGGVIRARSRTSWHQKNWIFNHRICVMYGTCSTGWPVAPHPPLLRWNSNSEIELQFYDGKRQCLITALFHLLRKIGKKGKENFIRSLAVAATAASAHSFA